MDLPELDLRLEGFEAADKETDERFWNTLALERSELVSLGEHHHPDGSTSYYVCVDESAGSTFPWDPEIVALYVQRDLQTHTFRFERADFPLSPMAQSWVIRRGCPPEAIELDGGMVQAADERTRTLERRLTTDGDYFGLGYSHTKRDPLDMVIVAATHSLRARDAAGSPYRALVYELDTEAMTYTLREGGFATETDAVQWCRDRIAQREGPLPPVRVPADAPQAPSIPPSAGKQTPGHSR